LLSCHHIGQFHAAETEKYAHVTYFLNGGREQPVEGEERRMIPSLKVATYDLAPRMQTSEVCEEGIKAIKSGNFPFTVLNFANPDMVGHTGIMEAAIKACEVVDECAREVVTAGLKNGYTSIIIADHGNCDTMINPDGSPNTAHTTNPVPVIIVDKDIKTVKDGILGDIAPTILKLIGVAQPDEMTRESLV